MEPPFEKPASSPAEKPATPATSTPPTQAGSAASTSAASSSNGSNSTSKKKGFLGMSFKRGKSKASGNEPASSAPTAAEAAATAAASAKAAAAMPAEAMAGIIDGCPLTSADYATAWKRMLRNGRRPKVSRLYTNLQGVLGDNAAMTYFVNYLKTVNAVTILKLFIGTDRFAKSFAEKSVDDRETDAMNLYTRYIASGKVALPDGMSSSMAKLAETKQFKATSFDAVHDHLQEILRKRHFANYQNSPHYSQYCISVLTSGTVYLEDMLYNESFLMGFIEFMTIEGLGGIIQFWLIADSFNDQLHSRDKKGNPSMKAEDAKGDAMGIYKRFIAKDAAEPLGVDERTRREIEKLTSKQDGPDRRSFLRALHLAHTALTQHFFPTYMQSDAFYQYLNSLVNASKAAESQAQQKQGDSGVAADGALNAEELGGPKGRVLRRSASQLGKVDGWGVYVRDEDATNELFNVAPQKSKVGKTLQVVGLKKKSAQQEQEKEMAVQVARMIITDVYKEMKQQSTIDKHLLNNLSSPTQVDPLSEFAD